MRTTVTIDDALLAKAKRVAAETGRSLSAVIDDALQESLNRREDARPSVTVVLPTFDGQLLPGIDLDNSAALRDVMARSAHGPAVLVVPVAGRTPAVGYPIAPLEPGA